MGNNLPVFELIRDGAGAGARGDRVVPAGRPAATASSSSIPAASRCGSASNGNVTSLDDEGPGVTPRSVIETVATAVHELGLPHPVHVHCNNLGVPGNWRTTLDTLGTLDGRRAHLAHLQFHAYGGRLGGELSRRGRGRRSSPSTSARIRSVSADVGQVMFGPAMTMTADAPVSAVLRRDHPRPLGQRRHRGRDRLRDRAVHLPRAELRARAAVGDRPRAVPAQPRPVAARPLHRPPQRRLVPQLPAPDPPAHGPRVPQRADPAGEPAGDAAHRAARRPRSRVHARGDRDHHARRAGAAARPARQGPPRCRRRRRHHDLRRPRRPRGDVRRAAPRDQGRARGRRGRRAARGRSRAACCGSARSTTRASSATLEKLFEDHYSVQFASYPVREPWLLEPARTVAAEPR